MEAEFHTDGAAIPVNPLKVAFLLIQKKNPKVKK